MDNTYITCDKKRIDLPSSVLLEGDWNYTRIHQHDLSIQMSSYTLKWYEQLLTDFIRVRKNVIINPNHVVDIKKDAENTSRLQLLLSNGRIINVARRRQTITKRRLQTLS
nr:LytTR family DNA-binding domain-containing protein [uncultured Arsenicibacter sp.]